MRVIQHALLLVVLAGAGCKTCRPVPPQEIGSLTSEEVQRLASDPQSWETLTSEQARAVLAYRLGLNKEDKLHAHLDIAFGLQRTLGNFLGTIVVELYWQQAPRTVLNFYRLNGAGSWVHPRTGQRMETALYTKTVFHRVIPNFMIQGGDPLGSGTGGPGYAFADEFDPQLRHDASGILSMANSGPNTNGSQFFITEAPTPYLDDRHSVFGKVVDGLPLVGRIARVERDARDMPLTKVVLEQVKIKRVAAKK